MVIFHLRVIVGVIDFNLLRSFDEGMAYPHPTIPSPDPDHSFFERDVLDMIMMMRNILL